MIYSIALALLLSSTFLKAQMVLRVDDTLQMPYVYLEEITIRAPKEAMSLRELPVSASVVSVRAIEQAGISSVKDITAYTPNFFMPEYGSKLTSPIYIRGIGSRINEPSVGLYVDNIPHFDKASFDFELMDIQRIEVLRGPQGTLYGRNTMGGIINIITRSPLEYQGTKIRATAGNYGEYQGGISHFGKAGNRFAYALSADYKQGNGYFTNTFNDQQVDDYTTISARNRLSWKINDCLTAENVLSFEYSRQGGYPYAIFDDSLQIINDVNYNHPSSYDRDLLSNGLLFRYEGKQFNLFATTSYQYLKDFQDVDQDFTHLPLFEATQEQLQHMLSQEIVARSKPGKKYDWLFGAYAFRQQFDRSVDVFNLGNNGLIQRKFNEGKQGFALFHQSTLHHFLIENLTVGVGLRLDSESDELDFLNQMVLGPNTMVLSDTLYPSLDFMEVSPRITFNYLFAGHSSVYALLAKGYKTGGFNAIFEREEDLMFDAEFSWNYEVGVKTALLDQHVQAEASVFYIDWKNQQIYQLVPSGQGMMLKNAGKSVSKGFELSARARTGNSSLMMAYGFTDATFTEYEVNPAVSYSGNFIPNVPRHTLSIQFNQGFELNSKLAEKLNFTALYRMVGAHYWNENNLVKQDAYGLLDVRAGLEAKHWMLELWVKNLLNTDYASFYFEALGNKYAQAGRPMRFGTSLTVKL